jgi:hypothetical protein
MTAVTDECATMLDNNNDVTLRRRFLEPNLFAETKRNPPFVSKVVAKSDVVAVRA